MRPPAAVGDVISAVVHYKPHAIALIDGAFMQNLATYHKELLDVMSRGIWVIGASSMGRCSRRVSALRNDWRRRSLRGLRQRGNEDDDEVALTHLAEEFEFRPVTEAMVNIRATMAAAVDAGVVSEPEAEVLVAAQKRVGSWNGGRWSRSRTRRTPLVRSGAGLSSDAFLRTNLGRCQSARREARPPASQGVARGADAACRSPEHVPSGVYGVLVERDITVGLDDGLPVTRDQIWRHFALNDSRAPEIVEKAILRTSAVELMRDAGIDVNDDDRARAAQAIAKDLGVEPDRTR